MAESMIVAPRTLHAVLIQHKAVSEAEVPQKLVHGEVVVPLLAEFGTYNSFCQWDSDIIGVLHGEEVLEHVPTGAVRRE